MSEPKIDAKKPALNPTPERPYFVHDPLGSGFMYFATEADRDNYSEDIIGAHLEDYWDEEVVNVVAGRVTSIAAKVDVCFPAGKIDEDGIDEDGKCWCTEIDYVCDYKLMPLDYVEPQIKELKDDN